jgi:hypothetical protein
MNHPTAARFASFKGDPSMALNLRRSFLFLLFVSLFICSFAASFAQNREKFVISAKAGGINAVTGRAKVHLKGGADWQQLSVTDDIEAGDMVRTETGARVEMLLNPGSYLRLGENSEFELVNNSLDNLEVKLLRGIAIVEATGADDSELMINISTPHTKLAIVRHGLYRLNVVPEDATELIVRKGRVMLNDSQKVKGGNKVIFSATTHSVAKLTGDEKKDRDETDLWSKDRAQILAKANRRISDRMLASAFDSFRSSDWLFGGGRRSGFWYFNPRSSCYTFVPFYYGWGSPYGSSYTFSIYNPFYCCSYQNYGWLGTPRANRTPPIYGGPGTGAPNRGNPGGGNGSSAGQVRTPPPNTRPMRGAGDSPARGRKPDISVMRPERNN